MTSTADTTSAAEADHVAIEPTVLYFGTPVVLLSTENDDGSANLAPISSAWALGSTIVLGLGAEGQSAYNLARRPQIVVNVPGPHLWRRVESLAGVTGRFPVPQSKPAGMRYEPDKFGVPYQGSHHRTLRSSPRRGSPSAACSSRRPWRACCRT